LGQNPQNEDIRRLLELQVTCANVAPAAAAGYVSARSGQPSELGAAGTVPGDEGRAPALATPETVFDLASVSKPIVACALVRLVEQGRMSFDTPLGELVDEARGTCSQDVPLELFLSHRAGLDAHRPLFAPVLSGRPFRRAEALSLAARARRPDCLGAPPTAGFAPLYSDLGYVLVGAAIEAATGRALDAIVLDEVARPLGVGLGSARQLRATRADFDRDVAPTEVVRARGGVVRGIVHDENAWALAGHAASGHAGLFGTAGDVLAFGAELLRALAGRSEWLSARALERLVRPRPGGSLRAGFDGKTAGASSAGSYCGPETFGHLGFTGTSLWCDPTAGVATVLLTNRVHPTRDNPRIRAARPLVHDALFRAVRPVLPGAPIP
jgi:CubicO group peptidase (beta-lactamase class C family)